MGDVAPMRGLAACAQGEAVVYVDYTCSTAIGGRLAARSVTEWAKRLGLTEAEFQILWQLRSAPNGGLDQTALANALVFSPAQISASVERLRAQGRICFNSCVADRRRHRWQLSAAGNELIDQALQAVTLPRHDVNSGSGREAAA